MAGIKVLREIKMGREATPGTFVLTSTQWRGPGTIEDQRVVEFPEEDIGIIGGVDRNYIPMLGGELVFDDIEATYEQVNHLWEAGIKTVSAVVDTGGSGFVYTYPFVTTAAQLNTTPGGASVVKTYVLEGGDNQQVETMEFCFVTEWKLSGEAGGALMMGGTWKGQDVNDTSGFGPGATPTVETILFSKGKLYIDTTGGTIGTTQKSNTFVKAELTHTTGLQGVMTADGELKFSFAKQIGDEAVLSITFEHDGSSVAEKAAWRNKSTRLIRLEWEGEALTTAGTFSNKTLRVDVAGRWRKFDKISESDGNDQVVGEFLVRYSAADALKGEVKLVNELSAVP